MQQKRAPHPKLMGPSKSTEMLVLAQKVLQTQELKD